MNTSNTRRPHPFARGNKHTKLPPKEPYSLGGYNQKTATQNIAEYMAKNFGKVARAASRDTKRRHIRRAEKHYEQHKYARMSKLPRPARQYLMRWAHDEMTSIDYRMWLNAQ